jgi:hypothetical protein
MRSAAFPAKSTTDTVWGWHLLADPAGAGCAPPTITTATTGLEAS